MKLYWLICFFPLCSGFTHNKPKPSLPENFGQRDILTEKKKWVNIYFCKNLFLRTS